jgi:hypothetical protein
MSKETPKEDPREQSDQGSHSQTNEPWKGNPEKEQRSGTKNPIRTSGRKPTRIEEGQPWDWHLTRSSAVPVRGG